MSVKVTEQTVYSEREPPADESPEVNYRRGDLSKPEMVDRDIEDDEHRLGLPEGEGDISITVQPGEQLGEFSINVQFEGPKGAHNFCMDQQNDLLLHASDWLREILEGFQGDFDVKIEARPCPKAEEKVEVAAAAQLLKRRVTLEEALRRRQKPSSSPERGKRRERTLKEEQTRSLKRPR